MMRAVVCLFAGLMSAALGAEGLEILSDGTRAVFSDAGALVSLEGKSGASPVRPADRAFSLQFLDESGEAVDLRAEDFECARERDGFTYRRKDGPVVRLWMRGEGGSVFVRTRVSDWPRGLVLNWIDAPQVTVSDATRTFWPFEDGCEVSDYVRLRMKSESWRRYRPVGWVKRYEGWGGLYPGCAQMQFLASYAADGAGVYFAARDARHTQKGVEWEPLEGNRVRLSLQTFCGDAHDGVYESGFEYEIRPYAGDWREACGLHRDWIRTLPAFASRPARPKWAEDSPVTLIYAVRGKGNDHGIGQMKPNEYFPYTNVLAAVERYARAFDARIMALVMHWEGTAPWCPPYVWPPYGGEPALAALRDALHARGDLLGVYCSGTAWTQVSFTDETYTRSAQFADENLGRFMMRGPKGEIDATICNHPFGQRLGYDLCLTEDWSRRTLVDEFVKIARFGIDYCQFFDQNLGGGANLCFCRRHRHPPVPGAWQTDAMLSLQREMLDAAHACGSEIAVGCEAAAAAPFVPNLYFNDSRPGFPRGWGKAVPGVAYVFHEWMCNFSGNQVMQPADVFYRWTRSFHMGDMMSVVLGPDGKLAKCWGERWDRPLPEQEPFVKLVRTFNDLRKAHRRFLLDGRMTPPFVEVGIRESDVPESDVPLRDAAVLSSFWEDAAGHDKLGLLTNWRREAETVTLAWPDGRRERRTLAPLETVVLKP